MRTNDDQRTTKGIATNVSPPIQAARRLPVSRLRIRPMQTATVHVLTIDSSRPPANDGPSSATNGVNAAINSGG